MKLIKFAYYEYENSPRYWELKQFDLNKINLIVGSNSSGKSRTLNVIAALARVLLKPKLPFNSGSFNASFKTNEDQIFEYSVKYFEGSVYSEKLLIDEVVYLNRDINGEGEMENSQLNTKVKFKIPLNELVVTRRDQYQYPYLEKLYSWAKNTRHFKFAKDEEKSTLALIDSNKSTDDNQSLKESNQAIEIFRKANAKYGVNFKSNVINDFNSIGYDISDVTFGVLQSIKFESPVGSKVMGLRVHENDRDYNTDQNEMSDGMFRALSIIIHYNYFALEGRELNVLIDDIGEGLDFSKSTKLINLLINKTENLDVQLIMSSNDKFVMNSTDLSYWQIISRNSGIVEMFNKHNSSEKFDDFKFTGLNNFDFLSTDFFTTGWN